MPSTGEVKQCLVYMDLAIKMQMIVFDLSSSLWWSTVAEVFIFFFALFVFFIDASRMGFIWMFIPHLARAAIGVLIVKKMPTTHELVANVQIEPNEKIPFSKVSKYVVSGAKQSVDEFQTKAGKFMMLYTLLTLIALVIDFIVIFIGIGSLSNSNGAFSSTFVLLLGLLYFFVAFYFIGWVICVRMRLPDYAQADIMMGLLGLFKKLTLALDTKFNEVDPEGAQKAAAAAAKASAAPSSTAKGQAAASKAAAPPKGRGQGAK